MKLLETSFEQMGMFNLLPNFFTFNTKLCCKRWILGVEKMSSLAGIWTSHEPEDT